MKYDFLAPYFKLSDPLEKMYVTQGFGVNGVQLYKDLGLDGHNGTDLRAKYIDTFAMIDAKVIDSGEDRIGGRFVKYRPKDALVNGDWYRLEIIHYHLQSWDVSAGSFVVRGQKIGVTGNTPNKPVNGITYSTAPHLHIGVKVFKKNLSGGWVMDYNNGYKGAVNPATFLLSRS